MKEIKITCSCTSHIYKLQIFSYIYFSYFLYMCIGIVYVTQKYINVCNLFYEIMGY